MKLVFDEEFLDDLAYWSQKQPEFIVQIVRLVKVTGQSPMRGIGDPFLLPEWGNGVWGRIINGQQVMIYVFELGRITFLRCRNRGSE